MAFLERISKGLCLDGELTSYPYRYTVYGDGGAYFEGIKGVISYSKNEICLSLKKGILTITGRDLSVKKLYGKDVAITGNVQKVEYR